MGKMIGGIFLIIGISIGAGILALPVTTATSGFFPSAALLLGCWVLMTFNALLILEVNMWLPANSNMISMAKATLGKGGQFVAWVSYLLLFYGLLSAYVAAGSDVLANLLAALHISLYSPLTVLLFAGVLGLAVYKGPHSVDYVNRGLISLKLGSFFLLMILMASHVHLPYLEQSAPRYLLTPLMVIITAFGFASLVPSLCNYFDRDIVKLRRVILIGSLVPLLSYVIWILVILGSLPLEGQYGLLSVIGSSHTTSALIIALSNFIGSQWVTGVARLFSSVSVATSFLGVAFAMSDFLADGFNVHKHNHRGNVLICALTLLPPIIVVLFYPDAFITALNYSGTCCVLLLAVLPGLMVWSGRYRRGIAKGYRVKGEKGMLAVSITLSVLVMLLGLAQELHWAEM